MLRNWALSRNPLAALIASLFGASEQGALYDLTLDAMYQDSAGTTAMYQPGQGSVDPPVGLLLDKRLGLVRGAQNLVDPTFNDATKWTTSATWSIGGGVCTLTNCLNVDGPLGTTAVAIVAGQSYEVIAVVTAVTLGGLRFNVGGVASPGAVTTPGTYRYVIVAGATSAPQITANGTSSGVVTSFKVNAIPGNHATQATGASRPLLSGRVNQLIKTEQFDDAYWLKTTAGAGSVPVVTPNQDTAPDGTLTADKVVFVAPASGDLSVISSGSLATVAGQSFTGDVYVKAFAAGDIGKQILIRHAAGASYTVLTLTSAYQRLGSTETAAGATATVEIGLRPVIGGGSAGTVSVFLWGADFRSGTSMGNYQRVVDANTYDTSGFPLYLSFNGTNSCMATGSINFSSTSQMTVWAGVRKNSDAATAFLCELTVDGNATNGGFYISAPNSPAASEYLFLARGTVGSVNRDANTFPAPTSNVLSVGFDTTAGTVAAQVTPRINGAVPSLVNGTVTTAGAFANAALFLGSRNSSTFFFNGRLYGLIVRGAQSTAAQILQGEAFENSRAGSIY